MLVRAGPASTRFHPYQAHVRIVHERREDPDRIAAAAHAGYDVVRQAPHPVEKLLAGLATDDGLEVAHHRRVGMRSDDRAEDVMRGPDIGDPVADRLVDRVLQRTAPGRYRSDLGPEQVHPLDVHGLPPNVLGSHVDDAVQPELGAHGRRSDAVLAGAGLRDDPLLAHPPGQ